MPYARGRDDQRRAFILAVEEQGERLYRLAEAHLVGEARARAPRREARQPLEPFALVVAQARVQRLGELRLQIVGGLNPADDVPPRVVCLDDSERVDDARGGEAHLHLALVDDERVGRLREARAKVVRDAREAPLADAHVAVAVAHGLEQADQRDGLAVDLHVALDAEPLAGALDPDAEVRGGTYTPGALTLGPLDGRVGPGLQLGEEVEGALEAVDAVLGPRR